MISLAQQTVFGRDAARIKCEGVGPPFDDMNVQTAVFPLHTHIPSLSHTHTQTGPLDKAWTANSNESQINQLFLITALLL